MSSLLEYSKFGDKYASVDFNISNIKYVAHYGKLLAISGYISMGNAILLLDQNKKTLATISLLRSDFSKDSILKFLTYLKQHNSAIEFDETLQQVITQNSLDPMNKNMNPLLYKKPSFKLWLATVALVLLWIVLIWFLGPK
jgi:hypothetical protein